MLLMAGCGSLRTQVANRITGALQYPPGDLPGVSYGSLPAEQADLLQLSDRLYRRSRRIDKLVTARTALKKIQEDSPKEPKMLWRLARIGSVLAQYDKPNAAGWARECHDAALQAIAVAPHWVQSHYYAAACSGLRAQHEPGKAKTLLDELIEHAEKAHEIQPEYDTGGPRRTLGIIYTLAPPWPSGPGDLDEAIELLEEVNKAYPKCPLNAFYLAEAYRRADQLTEARQFYMRAYRLGKKGRYGPDGAAYRRRIEAALYQVRREQ